MICLVVGSTAAKGGSGTASDPLIIGMAETMLRDVNVSERDILGERVTALVKEFTGLTGKLKIEAGAAEVARQLDAKEVQLGVMQGVEFAWMQKKHPKLKAFMVAPSDARENRHLYALLLVRKAGGAKSIADLKGKNIAYPKRSKEHLRLFTEKRTGGEPTAFFKSRDTTMSTENALDALVEGKVDAVIADRNAAEFYRRIKPGAYAKLTVAEKSEAFPISVLVYSDGAVAKKILDRFRSGMRKANTSDRGQDLMADWGIVSFNPVAATYQQDLEAIRKTYPGK